MKSSPSIQGFSTKIYIGKYPIERSSFSKDSFSPHVQSGFSQSTTTIEDLCSQRIEQQFFSLSKSSPSTGVFSTHIFIRKYPSERCSYSWIEHLVIKQFKSSLSIRFSLRTSSTSEKITRSKYFRVHEWNINHHLFNVITINAARRVPGIPWIETVNIIPSKDYAIVTILGEASEDMGRSPRNLRSRR